MCKIRIEKSKFFNAKIVLSTSHIPFTAHFFDDAVEVEVSNKFKNVLDKLKSLWYNIITTKERKVLKMKWFWIILIEMVVYLTILNIVKIIGVSIGSAFCIGYLTSGLVLPTVKIVFSNRN